MSDSLTSPSLFHQRIATWLNPERAKLSAQIGGLLTVICITLAMVFNQPAIAGIPFVGLVVLLWAWNFKPFYYLLLLSTPLSIEMLVGTGLSTDLPTEPLMLLLTGTFAAILLLKRKKINWDLFKHPLITVLGIQLIWYLVTLVFSQDIQVSAKWLAAKIWYIIALGGMTLVLVKKTRDVKTFFWCLFLPTLFTVIWTVIRHAGYNFGFVEVNLTMEPFYRNHVNYAVFLALIYPFIWLAASWYPRWSWPRMLLNLSKILFAFAIYFSYTRSSWISLAVGLVAYVLIRRNLLREATVLALVLVFGSCTYLLQNNRYLEFAPEFSKTIYHEDFSDHMAATTSLEDVSSAERIYRWVAGWYMFTDKPVTGFGPGNFFPYYQNYTVSSFYTYISRNEEQSTIHNYYLLTMVESGLAGSLLFWILIVLALFVLQRAYLKQNSKRGQALVAAVAVSFITILVNLFFSDLVEADKIGTMFYALLALTVLLDKKVLTGNKDSAATS